jgi:predicted pyridoxine 5'-phosphate oxidase superfamily flavin-nucleotide-binding protein
MLDADVRAVVASARLAFVATTGPDGAPHLSPKGSLAVHDDRHLIFLDIDSPGTVANLAADPRVSINVVDFLRRRGYLFTGTARFLGSGDPTYEALRAGSVARNGPDFPAHRAVLVEVTAIREIRSPAYTFGGAREDELAASWAERYRTPSE